MTIVKVILKLDLVRVLLGFSQFSHDPYYEPTIVVHDIYVCVCVCVCVRLVITWQK